MTLSDITRQELQRLYRFEDESLIAHSKELYECRIYQQEYLLRLSTHTSLTEQQAEAEWLSYLYENGVPVPQVLPSQHRQLVETLEIDGIPTYAVLLKKVPGRTLRPEEWTEELIERCGQIMGKMHKLSQLYAPLNSTRMARHWRDNDRYDYQKYFPAANTMLLKRCQDVFDEIKALPKTRETYGLIHAHIQPENILSNGKSLTIINFQRCEYHYFINDLAVILYEALTTTYNGIDMSSYSRMFMKALLKGYVREISLDRFWLKQLPVFLKLQEVLSLVICHREWDIKQLNTHQRSLMNLYRKNIEFNIPVVPLQFR